MFDRRPRPTTGTCPCFPKPVMASSSTGTDHRRGPLSPHSASPRHLLASMAEHLTTSAEPDVIQGVTSQTATASGCDNARFFSENRRGVPCRRGRPRFVHGEPARRRRDARFRSAAGAGRVRLGMVHTRRLHDHPSAPASRPLAPQPRTRHERNEGIRVGVPPGSRRSGIEEESQAAARRVRRDVTPSLVCRRPGPLPVSPRSGRPPRWQPACSRSLSSAFCRSRDRSVDPSGHPWAHTGIRM